MIFQIHVPLWDMTHFFKTPFSIFHKFQSTRPYGTRQIPKSELEIVREISIHAPLWDATTKTGTIPKRHQNFNPRAPVGRDVRGEN